MTDTQARELLLQRSKSKADGQKYLGDLVSPFFFNSKSGQRLLARPSARHAPTLS